MQYFIGLDPGGSDKTGVALLTVDGPECKVDGTHVSSVDAAIAWLRSVLGDHAPDGAGIDAPLSWSTGRSGWRPMDRALCEAYPGVANSVLSTNSAYGAMVVQGPAFAMRLVDSWPQVVLNETHPKVVYFALTGTPYRRAADRHQWLREQIADCRDIENEHEWDAAISAWAKWRGVTASWPADLMTLDTDDLLFPAGRHHYWWPETKPLVRET